MLTGPPNSFCSALRERSHLSFSLEIAAPSESVVLAGSKVKPTAWLLSSVVAPTQSDVFAGAKGTAFGVVADCVTVYPWRQVNARALPTGTERLRFMPNLPCCCGSRRVSNEVSFNAVIPGTVTFAQATPFD